VGKSFPSSLLLRLRRGIHETLARTRSQFVKHSHITFSLVQANPWGFRGVIDSPTLPANLPD